MTLFRFQSAIARGRRRIRHLLSALGATTAAALLGATLTAPAHGAGAPVKPGAGSATSAAAAASAPPAASVAPASNVYANAHPTWAELDPVQQRILAPFEPEWNTYAEVHRRKWMAIAAKYQKMSPANQARLEGRIAEWAKMSTTQRRAARENFQITRAVPQAKKTEAWDQYKNLPEDQKQKLASVETVPPRPGAASSLPSKKLPTQTTRHVSEHRPAARPATPAAASEPVAPSTAATLAPEAREASAPAAAAAESVRDTATEAPSVTHTPTQHP